jgi:phosphoacetylglucosamine mutase
LSEAGRPGLPPLLVDAANGVGAHKVEHLGSLLGDTGLAFQVRNRGGAHEGQLNEGCGADFVQKEQQPPAGFAPEDLHERRAASLDGDADRLVYFYMTPEGRFKLLDGDKIAALAASFIGDQLQALGRDGEQWRVGVVQTAYANGAATAYLHQQQRLQVRLLRDRLYLDEGANRERW